MSEYGSRIISANGSRQVDNKRMIPQLIADVWCGSFPAYDWEAQDGWIYRGWNIQTPQVAIQRPHVMFFSLPKTQGEVYFNGASAIFRPGVYVEPPKLYYFALDYVSYGNERYGRRTWGPTGQLLYDSGNRHLTIDQVFTNLNHSMIWTGDHRVEMYLNGFGSPKGYIPESPAISTDQCELVARWGNKSEIGEATAKMFYRFSGNQLQSIFCRDTYDYVEGTTSRNPYNHVALPAQPRTVMVIDRLQHDV